MSAVMEVETCWVSMGSGEWSPAVGGLKAARPGRRVWVMEGLAGKAGACCGLISEAVGCRQKPLVMNACTVSDGCGEVDLEGIGAAGHDTRGRLLSGFGGRKRQV